MNKSETFQTNIKISFCTITKNEESNIARCLNSVIPYVDEMIVVDTGSDDKTVEISQSLGAKFFYFEWCNDFAAAKNFSIAQATGEWILFLDADEELIVSDKNFLKIISNEDKALVFTVNLVDIGQRASPIRMTRIFRKTDLINFVGNYHEDLRYDGNPLTQSQMKHIDLLHIVHYGYTKENLLAKAEKRILLLESLLDESIDLNQLLTLSGLYSISNQLEKLDACYSKAFDYLLPNLISGEKPKNFRGVCSWLVKLCNHFLHSKDFENAITIIQCGLKWNHYFPPFYYLSGEILINMGFYLGAIPYFEECINEFSQDASDYIEPFSPEYLTIWPSYRLGCAYAELKNLEKAKEYFEQSLSYDPNYQPAIDAMQRLNAIAPIN